MSASTLHLDELPYRADSSELFARLRRLGGAALLDSCQPAAPGGRFDILLAEPVAGPPVLAAGADATATRAWFAELAQFQRTQYAGIQAADNDLPFCGGLVGYIGYEAGAALEAVPGAAPAHRDLPAGHLRAYDYAVIQDHLLRRAVMVSLPWVSPAERRERLALLREPGRHAAGPGFRLEGPFRSNLDAAAYGAAFEAIQAYIRAGDCYQVNLAQRFRAPCSGDPWVAYQWLREVARAPFSAYLEVAGGALLCLSPERFLRLQGQHVETRPIKGTRPRLDDPAADRALAEALQQSPKDRAENLMIVDLLRNDLGRSCSPGSIRVDRLFELESYRTVHHLVSAVSGELAPGRGPWELLRDSFPGGSITGAPKRRAMQIIAELEPDTRQAYCGSVLYVSADGRMDSNIAIRSLLCRRGELLCWGGGGIVADSEGDQEYQETLDKVGAFLRELERRGPSPGGDR